MHDAQAPQQLDEQAALGSGADFWRTKAVTIGAVEVPAITLTDGPHGLRRQRPADDDAERGTSGERTDADHLGLGASEPATCFPPAVALAQSWDPELVARVGAAIGAEAQALDVQVVLGPGVNIKRDPRCGRNFEYFSEDPHLAGRLGTAWVQGVQGQGVGASVKHFAVNNQERDRMRVSADLDPRPLREVYLRAFHRVVTRGGPWTVMAAYNRINGEWAVQDEWLLSRVLRDQWGFDGVVVSDWGAVVDRVRSVAAGLDLQMPGPDPMADVDVLDAVRRKVLSHRDVERAAGRVADLARRAVAARRPGMTVDADEHQRLARSAAARSIVLLRNDSELLPLDPSGSVAVIGEFARTPRYQGGGSSHVNATQVDIPLDEITRRAQAAGGSVVYAPGFSTDGSGAQASLHDETVRAAAAAHTAVVFLGLPEAAESEGFDRPEIDLPAAQLELLAAVATAQPRTVVVLVHGGVLCLAPVVVHARGLLDAALAGQGGGAAIAEVLYGAVNPSGKLAETVPVRLQDTPAYLNFPGESGHVRYGEGIFVGYRWYDARELEVEFPFGHGLSYTTFEYRDLRLRVEDGGIGAQVTVTNTGDRAGREVVQFYVGVPTSRVARPPRQLAGFGAAELEPGCSTTVQVLLERDDLVYWDVRVDDWVLECADYRVEVGASSRDIRLRAMVSVPGENAEVPLTLNSSLAEVAGHPEVLRRLLALAAEAMPQMAGAAGAGNPAMLAMMADIPIGRLTMFSGGKIGRAQLQQVLDGESSNG
ncbi:MAG TPA: glycoside hydrolase family 3 C-terminal domain-containing protein [Mycobacterium sp.]|nr:glycoside hydrolase family 3 C-terminal domain-containing protein [Mycobacterium sp.]